MTRTALTLGGLLLASVITVACAGDWPQWGGRDARNMVSLESPLPAGFDPGPTGASKPSSMPTTNPLDGKLKWSVYLGTATYSTPVVAGGKVFIGTNNPRLADGGQRGVLLCLDEATGRLLWRLSEPKYTGLKMFDILDLGISSSPAVEGGRAYLVTNRAEVVCLDAKGSPAAPGGAETGWKACSTSAGAGPRIAIPDAETVWSFDMIADLNIRPHDTTNCSPLIHGDYVYVCTSNGVDDSHRWPERPEAPNLIALDKKTGQYVARDDSPIGPGILHGQWSSPSLGVVSGKALVFFGAGDGFCYAFDAAPAKGAAGGPELLKKVWWFDCNGHRARLKDGKPLRYPNPDAPSEIIATPAFHNGRVYVATGQDPFHGDGPGALWCIDAAGAGDISQSGKVWLNTDIHRCLSTASVTDEILTIADGRGMVYCLDPRTGKPFWTHQLRGRVWGSTLIADGKIYIGDEKGDLVVFSAAKEEKLLAQFNLGSPIFATPVAANGTLYIATQTRLYAVARP
jgi:outer membrane protein assembly factor BamB